MKWTKMVFTGKISEENRAFVRFALKCKGMTQKKIMNELNISRSSFYRILRSLKTGNKQQVTDSKTSMWRPRKLSAHVQRLILRQLKYLRKHEGNFTVNRIMDPADQACKGVILCDQLETLNGDYMKGLVEREFGRMFWDSNNSNVKIVIEDGNPSQNAAQARAAWRRIGAKLTAIPPRSPDINPIENIFNIVKVILREDALRRNMTYKTFEDLSTCG